MSSLELSVVLLAGLAVATVFGYNLWIGRTRTKQPRPSRNRSGADNADLRTEPSLDLQPDSAPDSSGGPSNVEPGEPEFAAPSGGVPSAGVRAAPVLDPRSDCIVEFDLPVAVAGARLLHLTRDLRRAGSKPVMVETRRRGGDPHRWSAPAPDESCDVVRVGVLLANRHGPLNAMEYTEFVNGLQYLAEQLSVLADTPDMMAVLDRARDLDDRCASLDAQLGLGVEAPEPLGIADLARLAALTHCVERGNNRYARLGPAGEVLFSLALADAPNRLQLLLDVPRAPAECDPWREMSECATACARELGGVLVDDSGKPLPQAQIERIGQQIAQRQESLDAAGFAAGSALALRLFN
ncbi:MAG: hypothetical protein KJZ83_15010 [Burkholderiaceae bacterium]|nr:hypothetical protein [Burkholderiaceae bacterium]